MTNDPFGRQPQPVKVTLEGEPIDVLHYLTRLMRSGESCGEMVQASKDRTSFTIYPRAVND